jgi:serine/threonine protein kinase
VDAENQGIVNDDLSPSEASDPRPDPVSTNFAPAEEAVPLEEEIFQNAVEIADSEARDAYLEEACAGDANLRVSVEELLSTHAQAERFFKKQSAALKPPEYLLDEATIHSEANVGSCIGPYKLLKRLGEGGGGVVYQAEQKAPVRREVAIKVIKLGMDTRRVIARFEAEQQTLALMEHPNIAHVLDAGATESGRPYFVMELVRGVKITDFCEHNNISLRDRLRLFQKVCHAVQHAHQKGVIHRDLKPSNILITLQDGEPAPKVIDFGIAKATDNSSADGTVFTASDQFIGTPAYMSPEQIQGRRMDIDTRSDLYSLGVVLYELLAGRSPFDNASLLAAGIDEMRARVMREEPMRPSLLAKSQPKSKPGSLPTRPANAPRWAALLRGDLDWIALKALEKDRERRYQTARGLAFDIEHYLANEPVQARPPSRIYRLQKLVRRNKLVFAALCAAVLALAGGFTTSLWLYSKAVSAERQQARLRAESEEREKISKAAVYIIQGKIAEADAELKKLNGTFTQPSVEATNVYRELADWSAAHGEWKTAAERLVALVHVNRFNENDQTDNATRDLLPAAPTLIEAGDLDMYRSIRDLAITRFAQTKNPIAAEQIIKISLLLPADAATLARLKPLAQVAEASLRNRKPADASAVESWRYTALGLLEYRSGHFEKALSWCAAARANRNISPTREAISDIVQSMSAWCLGQSASATSSLTTAKALIDARFKQPLRNDRSGFWAEWLSARILLREALRMTSHPPSE